MSSLQNEEYVIPEVIPALEKLWTSDSPTAYFFVMETVNSYREYECK